MPDIYISRSGMESKAVEQKFTQTELGAVKVELAQMEQSGRINQARMRHMDDTIQKLQQDFSNLIKAMGASPSLAEAGLSLKRKRFTAIP